MSEKEAHLPFVNLVYEQFPYQLYFMNGLLHGLIHNCKGSSTPGHASSRAAIFIWAILPGNAFSLKANRVRVRVYVCVCVVVPAFQGSTQNPELWHIVKSQCRFLLGGTAWKLKS